MAETDDTPLTLSGLRSRPGRRGRAERRDVAVPEVVSEAPQGQMGLLFAAADGGLLREVEAEAGMSSSSAAERTREAGRKEVGVASLVGTPQAMPARSWLAQQGPLRGAVAEGTQEEERARYLRREPQIWGVRSLVNDLRERVEGAYREVMVEGEISTCRPASSGHLYLTLKEGEVQLSLVMFRRQAQLLRFRPTLGMAVLARGRLSVYEGRGELQLVAESLEPRGTGALLVAFERLKERLGAEGLFDAARKRALPAFPRTVGLVTSTAGAVLHDVVTVIRRRHAPLHLLVYPARVQGAGCGASVAAGIRWFNAHAGMVDLILLARGGGSPEDLCGFNEEALARVIAGSALPVVSAVGHETDFTIADFVSDLRAPTPSAAAELITEWQHRVAERVGRLEQRLRRASRMRLLEALERFARVSSRPALLRVQGSMDRRGQRVDELARRLLRAAEARQRARTQRLDVLQRALGRQQMGARLQRDGEGLERMGERLRRGMREQVARRRLTLVQAGGRLESLSPLAVLARGYALVYVAAPVHEGNEHGEEKAISAGVRLVRSFEEVAPGQRIGARLGLGRIAADVTETSS